MSATGDETRILDRGYRAYDGERLGVSHSMRSVSRYTAQRVLGLHRKARFKILPIIMVLLTYIPAVGYVASIVIINSMSEGTSLEGEPGELVARQLIQDYPGYYGIVSAAILLFAAFVAPEVLCTDRRNGMLGLYLSAPLDRVTYLLSKGLTVVSLLLLVTLGPPLLLLLGYGSQGYGPTGVLDWLGTLGRVIGAGLGLAAFHTTISLAISSVTTRKAAASATFVMLVIGSGVLVGRLIGSGEVSANWGSVNLLTLPLDFIFRVFGQPSPFSYNGSDVMATESVYVAMACWIIGSVLVIADRYRRLEVGT